MKFGPFSKLAASPDGNFLALFTKEGNNELF
jgi:hypothetical protein